MINADIVDPSEINIPIGSTVRFIHQLFDLTIQLDAPGQTANLDIDLPEALPQGHQWLYYSNFEGWSNITNTVALNTDATVAGLALVDGGFGDEDGTANSVISATFGPAQTTSHESPAETTTALNTQPESDSGGGGCFISAFSQ